MKFETIDLFGAPFEHVETYVYYDGRRTFAMRSLGLPDLYYIVNTVDEDEENDTLITLAVAVGSERFRAVRSGVVPFRDAFTGASSGALYRVDWTWNESDERIASIVQIDAISLPDSWLPTPTARLSMRTDTVERYEPSDLVRLSEAQSRTVFAIEVEREGARITEFPSRNGGELQVAVDGAIVALSREHIGTRKSGIARELRSSVLQLRAASFVLVMAVDAGDAMLEPIEVTSTVFAELNSFIDAVSTGDRTKVLGELRRHSPTTRNRLRDILRPLASAGSGLALSAAVSGTREIVRAAAPPVSISAAVSMIEDVEPAVSFVDIDRGVLTGLVLRTKRFEIFDSASGTPYKGYMSDDALSVANGLTVGDESFVVAKIRVSVAFTNDDNDASGVKYTLEELRPSKPDTGRNLSE